MTEESNNQPSNMKKIKIAICGNDTDPFYSSVWDKFVNLMKNPEKLFKEIREIIGEKCYRKYHSPFMTREELIGEATIENKLRKQNEQDYLDEVALERYIYSINENNNCGYQWCVGNQRESIDLVYIENDEITLIELKVNKQKKPCSPVLAFFESVKNYYLTSNYLKKFKDELKKEFKKEYKIKEICLLAEREYFSDIFKINKERIKFFMNEVITKFTDCKFKIYYIDRERDKLNKEIIDKLYRGIKSNETSYLEIKNILKNEIKTFEDWEKLCNS